MDFGQVVGIRFLRRGGSRRRCGVADRILALIVALLLRQFEDCANEGLYVFEGVAAECSGARDRIEPALDVECANVFEPVTSASRFDVTLPNIAVALRVEGRLNCSMCGK